LALLGRRLPERMDGIFIPASEKPAQKRTHALQHDQRKKKTRLAVVSPKSDQEFSASVLMRSANGSAVLAASAAGDSALRSCQA